MIRDDEQTLVGAPCDTKVLAHLLEGYEHAHASTPAIAAMRRFQDAKCEWTDALARQLSGLQAAGGHWAEAAAALDPVVENNPSDASAWGERAAAFEKLEDWTHARSDLRHAWLLSPRSGELARRYARALEKSGAVCSAWDTLGSAAWATPSIRGELQIERSRLADLGGCRRLRASASFETRVRQTPRGLYEFPVKVGDVDAYFGTDSASALTLLGPALAAKAGLTPEAETVITSCAMGTLAGHPVQLPLLQLGPISLAEVDALVVDGLPDGLEAVLGVNVFSRVDLAQRDTTHWKFTPGTL